jgi:hypothetical protein
MATTLNLESLNTLVEMMYSSHLGYGLALFMLILVVKTVIASWVSSVSIFEQAICPPVNPNVYYRYGIAQMQVSYIEKWCNFLLINFKANGVPV